MLFTCELFVLQSCDNRETFLFPNSNILLSCLYNVGCTTAFLFLTFPMQIWCDNPLYHHWCPSCAFVLVGH